MSIRMQKIFFQQNWPVSPTKWNFFLENLESDIEDLRNNMSNFIGPTGILSINASGFLGEYEEVMETYVDYTIAPSGIL